MRYIIFSIIILSACDFAVDPISNIFKLSKSVIVVNETIQIDPTKSKETHFIHALLFQHLSEVAQIETQDSLTWNVNLNPTYFSISSNDIVESEDIYYSLKKNENKILAFTKNTYARVFKKFEVVNSKSVIFEFSAPFAFDKLAQSDAFFIYSKHNSTFDIPIGTGTYTIILKPENDQYVLIPFTKFIHTQVDSINTVYWINSSVDEINKKTFNFELPDRSRFTETRNHESR